MTHYPAILQLSNRPTRAVWVLEHTRRQARVRLLGEDDAPLTISGRRRLIYAVSQWVPRAALRRVGIGVALHVPEAE